MRSRVAFLAVLALAPAGWCELPPETTALLQKLKDFETAEHAKAEQAIREKREAVIKTLQTQMDAATRKGNLDGAVEIRNIIAGLQPKAESVPAEEPSKPSAADVKVPEKAYRGRHAFYMVVCPGKPLTWTAASAECEKLGGKLASVEEPAELKKYFDALKEASALPDNMWVGGRKAEQGEDLRWLSGAVIDSKRFSWEGNKARLEKAEFRFVAMSSNGALTIENDRGFDRYAAFLCEWPK